MNHIINLLTNSDLPIIFVLDVVTVSILAYGIYFKRYFDRDAVTAAVLFNIFVFGVVTAFQNLDEGMGIGFGFGLFAVLSLITLRSEVLTKTDITYFFGALSIALINALSLPSVELVVMLNAVAVLAAWIVDPSKTTQRDAKYNRLPDPFSARRLSIIQFRFAGFRPKS